MEVLAIKRSVAGVVFLCLFTFGIYLIYWFITHINSQYKQLDLPQKGGRDFLLMLVTFGVYGVYIFYCMGKYESMINHKYGMPEKDDAVLYVIMFILGLSIITIGLLQYNANALAKVQGGEPPPSFGNWYSHE